MGTVSTGHVVSAALDSVLVPAGFAGGQYGEGGGGPRERTQIIFCAGHDEFSDRYPQLPQSNERDRGGSACIDLVFEIDADGKVAFLDLEGIPLAETLQGVGLAPDAEAVAWVMRRPLSEALPVVEAALKRLFETAPDAR